MPETYTNATSWYKVFTTVRDSDTKYSQDYNPFWCYKGAVGKVYHALSPKLTVIVPDVSQREITPLVPFGFCCATPPPQTWQMGTVKDSACLL